MRQSLDMPTLDTPTLDTPALAETPARNGSNPKARAERLLVVDDDPVNRDLMSRRFGRAGYLVQTVRDGQEALRSIANDPPDAVLVDLRMPRMSGLELLKTLRSQYTPAQLPVLMVSALNESSQIVVALTFGANDYLTKPIDFPVAIARIRTQLLRKQADQAPARTKEEK